MPVTPGQGTETAMQMSGCERRTGLQYGEIGEVILAFFFAFMLAATVIV